MVIVVQLALVVGLQAGVVVATALVVVIKEALELTAVEPQPTSVKSHLDQT